MIRVPLLLACLLVQGCAFWPFPTPPERSVPPWTCPSIEGVGGDPLDCSDSVAAALALLEPDDSDIAAIRFEYGPCPCPEGALCDCAFHQFGTVTIDFVDGPPKVMFITVDGNGQPVATRK